ncbi:MAG TPA: hypothetical protein VEI04_02675 [Syntrophobacteria bacterium]|nr:hypothetical protein [Syntrophobacteria bacterium]
MNQVFPIERLVLLRKIRSDTRNKRRRAPLTLRPKRRDPDREEGDHMGNTKGISEFLAGVSDLMKDEGLTFECLLPEDHEHVIVNFHTDVHEYSIGWDPYLEGGRLSLVIWRGSGERDLVTGPLNAATWEAIKAAIKKEDAECPRL